MALLNCDDDLGEYLVDCEGGYKPSPRGYATLEDLPEAIAKSWNSACDRILAKYVWKYGTYFTAFFEDILAEVAASASPVSEHIPMKYYIQFVIDRVYDTPALRRRWIESYREEMRKRFQCRLCQNEYFRVDCQPAAVKAHGAPPKICTTCNYIVRRRAPGFWKPKIEANGFELGGAIQRQRTCEVCDASFCLKVGLSPRDLWVDDTLADWVYANMFASICITCFRSAFSDCKADPEAGELSYLHSLYDFTGKIPTQDFGSFFYLFTGHGAVMSLFRIIQRLQTPEAYKEQFGSFFAALVRSGILPEGTRKLPMGTMALAHDGHLCFSLPEKEIDDFLFAEGIPHNKEVHYPGSTMRADWELLVGEGRVFVEYFGLMSNPMYARKATEKREIARQNNITLIPIYPDGDWRDILSRLKNETMGGR